MDQAILNALEIFDSLKERGELQQRHAPADHFEEAKAWDVSLSCFWKFWLRPTRPEAGRASGRGPLDVTWAGALETLFCCSLFFLFVAAALFPRRDTNTPWL